LKANAAPKARAKPTRSKRTHGQKCPHCGAHLRPLEPAVEQEQGQCIACDGWFTRNHVAVFPSAPPKLSEVDPRLAEVMEEGRDVREALALFEDAGPDPGACALCGRGPEPVDEGPTVEAGSFEQFLNNPMGE
jgi:hypothetical protein